MLRDLVDKYASLLSGRDVNILFDHLRELTNRSEAARLCDLERRTTYYWRDNREIRLSTKQKVLQAILEKDYTHTLRYLCQRTFDISSETVRLYLGTLYERALDPEIESTQYQTLANEFREARIRFSPMINSTITPNLSHMLRNLKRRSDELGFDFPTLPISTMNIKEMMSLLPQLIKVVPSVMSESDSREISRRFGFHQDLVEFASNLKTEYFQVSELPPDTPDEAHNENQFPGRVGRIASNTILGYYKRGKNLENVEVETVPRTGSFESSTDIFIV